MKILNTKPDPKPAEPSEEDIEELRRLFAEALKDPDGFVITSCPIEIDADGTIIIKD